MPLTAYHADESGRELGAITAFGILDGFTGVAIPDAYATHYSDAQDQAGLTHTLCIAHIQRELRGIAEHDPDATKGGWASQLDERTWNLFRWRENGHEQIPKFKIDKITR